MAGKSIICHLRWLSVPWVHILGQATVEDQVGKATAEKKEKYLVFIIEALSCARV